MVFGAFFAIKHSTRVAAKSVESRLGKPSLVRETSRFNVSDIGEAVRSPIKVFVNNNGVINLNF